LVNDISTQKRIWSPKPKGSGFKSRTKISAHAPLKLLILFIPMISIHRCLMLNIWTFNLKPKISYYVQWTI